MTTERERWLAMTLEDALEPDLAICDPHHHLWDRPNDRYLLEDVLKDTGGGHHIVQTVFVQCGSMYRKKGPEEMRPIGETEFVQGIAAQSASGQYGATEIATGIVGFADLRLGAAVTPVLEAHRAASKNRFRGVRHISAWDASPVMRRHDVASKGLLLDSTFRKGFARLQEFGMSFDAWLYFPQLDELADLVKAFPDIRIIINHVGGPLGIGPYAGRHEEVFQTWKRSMARLAGYPNVVVKVGGFGMPACGFGWHERAKPPTSAELAKAIAPYCLFCIETFGVERCMFESNFPVDKVSYSYTVVWNAFKRITKEFSLKERAALFQGTAARVYRLDTDDVR